MTTRARLVFGLFVGLTTYGYLRLSTRLRFHSKVHAVYGKRMQRGHHYHLYADDTRTSVGIAGTPAFGDRREPIHAD